MATIETPLTKLFGIKYPILLAGMNKAAGPKLAAAVTNAGGLGVIGGVGFTPRILKLTIKHLKQSLDNKDAPFGVDLLLPQIGGSARKTNYDYTKGKLDKLIDVIIDSGAKLFVSAVGVPPKSVVDKLHAAGIPVMNMVGHPKHVKKALAAGVDIICAQGGEGGGHTGNVPTSLLLPQCVDLVRGRKMPLDPSQNVCVVGAGGIYDGRGLAMALSYGCEAVWVGTRFVCSEEAGASAAHKEAVMGASIDDTMRTLIYTGRPMRIVKNKYAVEWETRRSAEMKELLSQGTIPYTTDFNVAGKKKEISPLPYGETAFGDITPYLSGQVAGAITDVQPAKVIIENMVQTAIQTLRTNQAKIKLTSKL